MSSTLAVTFQTVAAEGPPIMTSFPPVHGLVLAVTSGITKPDVLVPPGTDLREFKLTDERRSELMAYSAFVWVGNELAFDPNDVGPPGPRVITLMDDAAAQASSGEAPTALWLDPENGKEWANQIAEALGELDPQNQPFYSSNARGLRARLDAFIADMRLMLLPVQDKTLVLSDATLLPLADRFNLKTRVAETAGDAACDIRYEPDPQANTNQATLAQAVQTDIGPGPSIGAPANPYLRMLQRVKKQIAACLSTG